MHGVFDNMDLWVQRRQRVTSGFFATAQGRASDDQERFVILGRQVLLVIAQGFLDGLPHFPCGLSVRSADFARQAPLADLFSRRVARFGQSVGVQHNQIARVKSKRAGMYWAGTLIPRTGPWAGKKVLLPGPVTRMGGGWPAHPAVTCPARESTTA